jgi:hypothetical protein
MTSAAGGRRFNPHGPGFDAARMAPQEFRDVHRLPWGGGALSVYAVHRGEIV